MSKANSTKGLEEYLERNAFSLVASDEKRDTVIRAARNDVRARRQRAQRLQSLRRNRLKLTQGDLAKAVGANVRTLQSWERGRQEYPRSVEILMHLMDEIPVVKRKLVHGADE